MNNQVEQLFDALSEERRSEILYKALQEGANKLADSTRQQLRARIGAVATSGNRPLEKGIKVRAEKAYNELTVHIMGDYRLKWFEKATKPRETKKKANRGIMLSRRGGALNFFRAARQENVDQVMLDSIDKQIQKI